MDLVVMERCSLVTLEPWLSGLLLLTEVEKSERHVVPQLSA